MFEIKCQNIRYNTLDKYFQNFEKAINEVIFHPTIQDKIYVLETNEIAISTDGGANWSVQTYSPWVPEYYFGLSATFNPYDANEVIYTSNWYPFRSTDGGSTIQRMFSPYSFTTYVGIANADSGQDPYLYYGVQEGLASKNLNTSVETAYGVQSVDIVSGNAAPLFFVDQGQGQYGRIFSAAGDFNGNTLNASTDHGQSFQTFYTGFYDPVLNIYPDPVNNNEVWASFELFMASGTFIIDITSPDPWSPTISQVTMPSTGRHYSTWVNPSNNQEVLAGIGGELWSSLDRGATWTNSSTGLTLDINSGFIYNIVKSPYNANEFVLATENGVWKSTDNYATWTNILPTNHVTKISYDPNNPEVLVAGVNSSAISSTAVYYSEDYGSTWNMIPVTELEYSNSNGIAFDFIDISEGFRTFIATPDLGVITYDVLYATLSIETPTIQDIEMTMYPNPVKDVLNISFKNGNEPNTIVVYNILGATVKRFNKGSHFDLSDLNPGMYLVKVSDSNGNKIVKRIIKK
ncbi:T9SS type A sorting domain-containing protein [Xanthomarina spongicola]|uniref:Putative secreted protein (Por secretion system target) n=1 Tax=Xanthomarina spongicola TaxID=570520 RepID=A0A316DNN8_9FLAO|nr:T9SS type A sorting domain-containing protein [Xanthomarina spongicola]PWK19661.1 putative secreted protein (Por secretion system target) [Xanthomarina spongicola]